LLGIGGLKSHQISAASDHPAFGVENTSPLKFLDVRCKWSLLVRVKDIEMYLQTSLAICG